MPPTTRTGDPAGQPLGQQPRRGLGRGHHVAGGRGHAHAVELGGDGRRGTRGVVGHVGQPHAAAGRLAPAPRPRRGRPCRPGRRRRPGPAGRRRRPGRADAALARGIVRAGGTADRRHRPSAGTALLVRHQSGVSSAELVASAQCRPDAAQGLGVVPQVGPHGGGQGQVLGGRGRVAGPGQGQAQPELGVVVARAGLDDAAGSCRRPRRTSPASNWARARASSTLRDCGSAAAARSSSWAAAAALPRSSRLRPRW